MGKSPADHAYAALSPCWVPSRVLAALGLCFACASTGCYCPLRWPRQAFWAPTASPSVIQLPKTNPTVRPGRLQQDGVTVSVEWMDAEQTREAFHANLVHHGIQPLRVVIYNGSEHPYAFRKAGMDAHYIPAAQAARWACVHPAVVAARYTKWLVFLVPGLLFESVIEPTSTLDFPNLKAAAQRPAIPRCRGIRDEFLRHEIADALIPPDGSLAGVLFVPPSTLGSTIPLALIDERTQQPLVFQVPTPPPVYTASQTYAQPPGVVWNAAVKAVHQIKSWRVVAADPKSGVISVRKGFRYLGWNTAAQITVTVQKAKKQQTRVTVESTLRRSDTTGMGEHSPTIDRFFSELATFFPPPPRRVPPSSSTPRALPHVLTGEQAPRAGRYTAP